MLVRTSRGLRPRLTDVLRPRRAARRQRSERYRRSSDGRPAKPSPAPLWFDNWIEAWRRRRTGTTKTTRPWSIIARFIPPRRVVIGVVVVRRSRAAMLIYCSNWNASLDRALDASMWRHYTTIHHGRFDEACRPSSRWSGSSSCGTSAPYDVPLYQSWKTQRQFTPNLPASEHRPELKPQVESFDFWLDPDR